MSWTVWIMAGSIAGALGVALGAFGAHAWHDSLTPQAFEIFQTASRYHLIHSLALVAVGLVGTRIGGPSIAVAGAAFSIGILLFCGSLYGIALAGLRLGVVAPIGGTALIIGWLALGVATLPWASSP